MNIYIKPKIELQEKSLLLNELQHKNKELSRLIHKDNKLIPAMEKAVYKYLRYVSSNQSDALSQLSEIATADDIVHLLADLIENAIISISGCPSCNIKLQIYQHGKYPFIELSDTGIPFEISTLTNLGVKTTTTHAESGGTGIGLMDVWELKKKHNASLHIIEYESASPFQKKVSLLFDRKNQYLIYTWREEAIKPFVQRIDMHVLANNVTTD